MNTSILRTKRQERGLTLSNVARVVGIDNGNLSRIERGIQLPEVRLGKRLATLFNITLDEVYANVGADETAVDAQEAHDANVIAAKKPHKALDLSDTVLAVRKVA